MIRRQSRLIRFAAPALALSLLGAACGGDDDDGAAAPEEAETTEAEGTTIAAGPDTRAAKARVDLASLLQEHVYLAAGATNAALAGLDADFSAAATAHDTNSVDLSEMVGSVLGADAEKAFLGLWRSHIGFFVNYATATAAGNADSADTAVSSLLGYTGDFTEFVKGALPSLDAKAVTTLLKTHVETLKGVIDAQAAKDHTGAYAKLRTAAAHTSAIAQGLIQAMATEFPKKLPGDSASSATNLVSLLNNGLREHVFLTSAATGAALGKRAEEFAGASEALAQNSESITASVAAVYGDAAGSSFGPLWEQHITMVIEYTTGLATGDAAKSDKAVADLTNYARDFGAFLNSASPELPAEDVTTLVGTHVTTLKSIIDAQAANDPVKAFTDLRAAAAHMGMIAEALTVAIVEQFPALFPGAAASRDDAT
ncbi:MAG: hypothetical protein ACRDY7_06955 [Acidimicrobiia bacterium]